MTNVHIIIIDYRAIILFHSDLTHIRTQLAYHNLVLCNNNINIAKLGDGYGWRQQKQQLGKHMGILKPSWSFAETNKTQY